MPRMQFGLSAFERARGDLPELPVINMFAEEAPTEETGVVLQSRPGLSDRAANMGAGPVEALFQRDGVLAGALFGVSAGNLYTGTTLIGLVAGSGAVSIAGNEIGILATAGLEARYWNGTALSSVSFPDAADVAKVANGASRFWLIRKDTGKLYFTPALAATVASLSFITAESLPDKLLDMVWIDDVAVLFGAESVEFWPNTGDSALPIQPLEGRVFEKGIRATGCAAVFDSSFAWVGNDNVVYTNGPAPQPISNAGLDEKIKASGTCRLFTFYIDGQEFLALRLDTSAYVYGARNKVWSQFASYGQTNWLPMCHAGGVFGTSDGRTLAFNTEHLDMGAQLERRFRAGFALNAGGLTLSNVGLRVNVGQTPYLTGDHLDPQVEMRISRDAGQTFGIWQLRSLGKQGAYRTNPQWRACGMASRPGSLHEFRCTSPIPFRVSEVLYNEPFGGR